MMMSFAAVHLCRNARADRELLDALPLFFGRGFISQIQAGDMLMFVPNQQRPDIPYNYRYTDVLTQLPTLPIPTNCMTLT